MEWPLDDDQIVDLIILHEKGWANFPDDKGGPTNDGITLDTLASWRKKTVTVTDLKNMPMSEKRDIYRFKYLIGPNFDQLKDVRLRAAMVDFGVLFGPVRATQALQLIVKETIDGILGPNTLATANMSQSRAIINQLSGVRISKHADRVSVDPTQLQFLKGWINRALQFIE